MTCISRENQRLSFEKKTEKKANNPKELISMARQVYIKPKDIERHGLTRGCKQCDHERNYGPGRTAAAHSKICRVRITKERPMRGRPELHWQP